MITKLITTFGGLAIGVLITEILWRYWENVRCNSTKQISIEDKTINEVFLFSDECSHCRSHANTKVPCSDKCPVANVKRLVYYLESSLKTLDVCMYIMTCKDITNAIIKAQKRKVVVRVIVDASMFGNGACYNQLEQMKRNGIKIRMQRSNLSLMHHKFALIDGKIMIYGSSNWTMQAFYGNFDGILVTNHCNFVIPFNNEFNRMWKIME